MQGTTVVREVPIHTYPFLDYFKGFEDVLAVQATFGEKTKEVLQDLRVEFFSSRFGYMGVNDEDGHLMVSAHYLRNGSHRDLYLDVIHELVHVRQFREGKKLFEEGYEYVDLPTEIEAYGHAIREARRLGMADEEILEYLKTEWMSEEELHRLARNVGIKAP
jgi:hypothetical protein